MLQPLTSLNDENGNNFLHILNEHKITKTNIMMTRLHCMEKKYSPGILRLVRCFVFFPGFYFENTNV